MPPRSEPEVKNGERGRPRLSTTRGSNRGVPLALTRILEGRAIGNRWSEVHLGGTPQTKAKRYGLATVVVLAVVLVIFLPSPVGATTYRLPDFTLGPNQKLVAKDTTFIMQGDGNLVVYQTQNGGGLVPSNAVWSSQTFVAGSYARLQATDGNFVVYAPSGVAQWSSGTAGTTGATLVVADDGNVSIFNSQSQLKWSVHRSRTPTSGSVSGTAPVSPPWADGKAHSHVSVESNGNQKAAWQWKIDGPGGENVYEPTDLTFSKKTAYATWIDIYWYADPTIPGSAVGDALCVTPLVAGKCDQFRLRFEHNALGWLGSHMTNNLVCHEIGHSVLFRDGGTTGSSCMTAGDNSRLGWWEKGTINAWF